MIGYRKSLTGLDKDQSLKMTINEQGIFILYHVANLFLSTDYEKCLSVCSTNFSSILDNSLFESNILRFKALALEQIFVKYTAVDKDENLQDLESIDEIKLILDALEAVKA